MNERSKTGASKLETVYPPHIGGSSPHDFYIATFHSIAVSLKRIADQMERNSK